MTLEFQIGQYQRNETLSFTQPYLFDRPLQFGWSVYHRSYNYNQAALTSIQQTNQVHSLPASYQDLLQNFTQTSTGFTTSFSYPIKRSFKRVGITYSFDDSSRADLQRGLNRLLREHSNSAASPAPTR